MRHPTPSREQLLLFDLLRGNAPLNLDEVNTSALFDLFQRHRLFPVAQDVLSLLPENERSGWKEAIRSSSLRTLHFTSLLKEVLIILNRQGIEVIPLKGPALAYQLYGDFSQKNMRDLDLLVLNGDILKAVEVLIEAGFQLSIPKAFLSTKQWNYYFRHQYDVSLKGTRPREIIELHAGIVYPGFIRPGESLLTDDLLTDDLRDLEISGVQMKSLSKESTFLYLAVHGAHHLFFRLFWLRDLAEAMRRWDLDHQVIFEKAQVLGIERMVGLSIRLAEFYFGLDTPVAWKPYLEKHASLIRRLENRCHRIIRHPRFLSRRNRFNVLCFTMSLKPGWRHKGVSLSTVFHRWYIRRFLTN